MDKKEAYDGLEKIRKELGWAICVFADSSKAGKLLEVSPEITGRDKKEIKDAVEIVLLDEGVKSTAI